MKITTFAFVLGTVLVPALAMALGHRVAYGHDLHAGRVPAGDRSAGRRNPGSTQALARQSHLYSRPGRERGTTT